MIFLLGLSAVESILPKDMTNSAMGETAVRMEIYLQQNQSLPNSLDVLPIRQGYPNRTTDGWGRPLNYVSEKNEFTLTSLGKAGVVGGSGEDADIVREFRLVNAEIEQVGGGTAHLLPSARHMPYWHLNSRRNFDTYIGC